MIAAADHLAAVVLLRIVRRRDLRAAVEIVGRDGVIDHVGRDHPVVDDVGALLARAGDERRGQARRRHPHVASDADALRLEVGDKRAANLVKDLLVELCRIETANVVGFENVWVHRRLYSAMDVVSPSTPPRSWALRPICPDRPMMVSVTVGLAADARAGPHDGARHVRVRRRPGSSVRAPCRVRAAPRLSRRSPHRRTAALRGARSASTRAVGATHATPGSPLNGGIE